MVLLFDPRVGSLKQSREVWKAVDHLSVEWGQSRGPTIERLLREAMEKEMVQAVSSVEQNEPDL